MSRTLAILKKEISQYFFSPILYVAFAIYFFIVGMVFILVTYIPSQTAIDGAISFRVDSGTVAFAMTFILSLLILPFFSMRLLSEEMRQGTDELLLTSPANLFEIILGKYLSSLVVLLMMIAVSLIYPLIIMQFGAIDWGILFTGYLVFFLIGGTVLAIGLFTSAMFKSPVVAAITSLVILFILWLSDSIARSLFFEQQQVIAKFSLIGRMENLKAGLLSLNDVVFYLSFIVVFFVLTIKVFERKRWN